LSNFAPIYVFWGEEKYLISKEVKKLKKEVFANSPMGEAFNYEKVNAEVSTNDLIARLQGVPFGSDMRLIVADNPIAFSLNGKNTAETEANDAILMDYVEKFNPQSVLVLVFDGKLDKRKSLYKFLTQKGTVVEFNSLKGKDFSQWAIKYADERGKTFSNQSLGYLSLWDGTALEVMANELDKVCTYVGDRKRIEVDDLELMLTATAEANVFKMIDMLSLRKAKDAVELLNDCLRKSEAPLMILALMVRQFRNLLLIKKLLQRHYNEKEIAQKLNLQPFVVSKGIKQCYKYTEQDLRVAMEKLLNTEVALKSTNVDARSLMERLVVELC